MSGPVRTFVVGGNALEVGDAYWSLLEGPKPPSGFACDGCSMSPDAWTTWRGRTYKLWPACVVHDYHYRTRVLRVAGLLPGTAAGRKQADDALYRNITALVRAQGGTAFEAHRIAWVYWGRVRVWGAGSYQHWDEGAEPLSRWARIKEVW